jgi:hypothetical protein
MTRNWAVAIGINSYNPNHFAPLRYAKRDAEQMRDFFGEAGFNEVCFFSDDSPPLQLPNGASVPTLVHHLHAFFRTAIWCDWWSSSSWLLKVARKASIASLVP